MLVSILKGHTANVIGCDFLPNRNLLSVDETGILNVFNYKVPNPIASQMINKAKFKEVAFFTNKQQFAILSEDNRIFIVQISNVSKISSRIYRQIHWNQNYLYFKFSLVICLNLSFNYTFIWSYSSCIKKLKQRPNWSTNSPWLENLFSQIARTAAI